MSKSDLGTAEETQVVRRPAFPIRWLFAITDNAVIMHDALNGSIRPILPPAEIDQTTAWVWTSSELFFTGGRSKGHESDCVYATRLDRLTFRKCESMTEARMCHDAACNLNADIYVVGGRNANILLRSCERYSIRHDRWHRMPSLLLSRQNTALLILDQRVLYAIGGYVNSHNKKSVVERLDLLEENAGWSVAWTAPELERVVGIGVVLVAPSHVLIFGGKDLDDNQHSQTLIFDVRKMNVQKLPTHPVARCFFHSKFQSTHGMHVGLDDEAHYVCCCYMPAIKIVSLEYQYSLRLP